MGKRSEFERRKDDFYPTPLGPVEILAPHINRGEKIAEPCAGDGAICEHLWGLGFEIAWAADIAPGHELVVKRDVMHMAAEDVGDATLFITNPPWPLPGKAGEPTLSIIAKLASLRRTWVLLNADFMHNGYAAPALTHCAKIVTVGRVKWIAGSASVGKENCCWYLFDWLYEGRPIFVGRV